MTGSPRTISRDELSDRLARRDGLQLVSVVEPEEYDLGLIPGSLKIPLSQLDQRMSELDRARAVVTYCGGADCLASQRGAEKLHAAGFDVRVYEGGLRDWRAGGLPVL
jgi:rhodanese-related sulfurtransferase